MKDITLATLRAAHPLWFDRKTARFFGDSGYRLLKAKSGQPFLIRKTSQWSDMFGQPKVYRYRLNPIGTDLEIRPLVEKEFRTTTAAREWLRAQMEYV